MKAHNLDQKGRGIIMLVMFIMTILLVECAVIDTERSQGHVEGHSRQKRGLFGLTDVASSFEPTSLGKDVEEFFGGKSSSSNSFGTNMLGKLQTNDKVGDADDHSDGDGKSMINTIQSFGKTVQGVEEKVQKSVDGYTSGNEMEPYSNSAKDALSQVGINLGLDDNSEADLIRNQFSGLFGQGSDYGSFNEVIKGITGKLGVLCKKHDLFSKNHRHKELVGVIKNKLGLLMNLKKQYGNDFLNSHSKECNQLLTEINSNCDLMMNSDEGESSIGHQSSGGMFGQSFLNLDFLGRCNFMKEKMSKMIGLKSSHDGLNGLLAGVSKKLNQLSQNKNFQSQHDKYSKQFGIVTDCLGKLWSLKEKYGDNVLNTHTKECEDLLTSMNKNCDLILQNKKYKETSSDGHQSIDGGVGKIFTNSDVHNQLKQMYEKYLRLLSPKTEHGRVGGLLTSLKSKLSKLCSHKDDGLEQGSYGKEIGFLNEKLGKLITLHGQYGDDFMESQPQCIQILNDMEKNVDSIFTGSTKKNDDAQPGFSQNKESVDKSSGTSQNKDGGLEVVNNVSETKKSSESFDQNTNAPSSLEEIQIDPKALEEIFGKNPKGRNTNFNAPRSSEEIQIDSKGTNMNSNAPSSSEKIKVEPKALEEIFGKNPMEKNMDSTAPSSSEGGSRINRQTIVEESADSESLDTSQSEQPVDESSRLSPSNGHSNLNQYSNNEQVQMSLDDVETESHSTDKDEGYSGSRAENEEKNSSIDDQSRVKKETNNQYSVGNSEHHENSNVDDDKEQLGSTSNSASTGNYQSQDHTNSKVVSGDTLYSADDGDQQNVVKQTRVDDKPSTTVSEQVYESSDDGRDGNDNQHKEQTNINSAHVNYNTLSSDDSNSGGVQGSNEAVSTTGYQGMNNDGESVDESDEDSENSQSSNEQRVVSTVGQKEVNYEGGNDNQHKEQSNINSAHVNYNTLSSDDSYSGGVQGSNEAVSTTGYQGMNNDGESVDESDEDSENSQSSNEQRVVSTIGQKNVNYGDGMNGYSSPSSVDESGNYGQAVEKNYVNKPIDDTDKYQQSVIEQNKMVTETENTEESNDSGYDEPSEHSGVRSTSTSYSSYSSSGTDDDNSGAEDSKQQASMTGYKTADNNGVSNNQNVNYLGTKSSTSYSNPPSTNDNSYLIRNTEVHKKKKKCKVGRRLKHSKDSGSSEENSEESRSQYHVRAKKGQVGKQRNDVQPSIAELENIISVYKEGGKDRLHPHHIALVKAVSPRFLMQLLSLQVTLDPSIQLNCPCVTNYLAQ